MTEKAFKATGKFFDARTEDRMPVRLYAKDLCRIILPPDPTEKQVRFRKEFLGNSGTPYAFIKAMEG